MNSKLSQYHLLPAIELKPLGFFIGPQISHFQVDFLLAAQNVATALVCVTGFWISISVHSSQQKSRRVSARPKRRLITDGQHAPISDGRCGREMREEGEQK
jgi:hypothetical protein